MGGLDNLDSLSEEDLPQTLESMLVKGNDKSDILLEIKAENPHDMPTMYLVDTATGEIYLQKPCPVYPSPGKAKVFPDDYIVHEMVIKDNEIYLLTQSNSILTIGAYKRDEQVASPKKVMQIGLEQTTVDPSKKIDRNVYKSLKGLDFFEDLFNDKLTLLGFNSTLDFRKDMLPEYRVFHPTLTAQESDNSFIGQRPIACKELGLPEDYSPSK